MSYLLDESFSKEECGALLYVVSSPCTCVQYRGDILSTMAVYLKYHGGITWASSGMFRTVGEYHENCEGISWVPWEVLSPVGVILSTMEDYL